MNTYLYGYQKGSSSAKALARALGIKRIKHEGSRFRGGMHKIVINWGSSSLPAEAQQCLVHNSPHAVKLSSNKLSSFLVFKEAGISTPRFTTDKEEAKGWGTTVVCRHKLTGHSGEGIEIIPLDNPIPDAKLYVEYIKKQEEYRLHVMYGEVFFIQRKARSRKIEDEAVNWQVRNHKNGFIYANLNVDLPDEVKSLGEEAVNALGLDFGAVDLIWNEKQNRYYVLEVNTAPGLYGTTLQKYVEAFREVLK